ncbi:GAF domain-containing SpoIIE family protein phosphatase [Streptomyces sp. TRM 70351]|uniref:PP2C family protein-serine/threonine phosphatase n=1 Tax=Streptomyces sp. TRM 70351 TaxID=3116552 RepID=UPI002E7C2C30|nr:GAF domain-containing SpoIIE family protein phosphatase [Streptomyces sp. TRM 70351]MEE1930104.1 GAF domain-containing SpoIIE family protein phosphatase [Streptomyces sp. TRM 70351]
MEGTAFPGGLRDDGLPAALSDPARLAAVAATGLLDTGPEEAFDDLSGLAATATGCRRAFITLVDGDRSYGKSCVGVEARTPAERQHPVGESFCSFLVGLEGAPFVVEDAARDPRTRSHPALVPQRIGAWAGYPVLAPGGEVLGSLCVIDENPRAWQPTELTTLATLARAVGNEINLRESLDTARSALRTSNELARSLQDSLLPPALQRIPGLETAASYLPAAGGTTVVGDFYDLFHTRGPWWSTVMGDVSGKGTEAAKVTALARYTLRAEATRHLSPAAVLGHLNSALISQGTGNRFLTAVYATFRTTPGGLAGRLCTAGHPPALIRRADGRVREAGARGTLLGVVPGVSLTDVRFRLAPGDVLLLYTDGATEARASRSGAVPRAEFGENALAAALSGCGGLDASGIVERLGRILDRHSGGWASDDTALLAIRVPHRP